MCCSEVCHADVTCLAADPAGRNGTYSGFQVFIRLGFKGGAYRAPPLQRTQGRGEVERGQRPRGAYAPLRSSARASRPSGTPAASALSSCRVAADSTGTCRQGGRRKHTADVVVSTLEIRTGEWYDPGRIDHPTKLYFSKKIRYHWRRVFKPYFIYDLQFNQDHFFEKEIQYAPFQHENNLFNRHGGIMLLVNLFYF